MAERYGLNLNSVTDAGYLIIALCSAAQEDEA